jgi:hypothetical protein
LASRFLLGNTLPTFTFNIERGIYNVPEVMEARVPESDRYDPDGLLRFYSKNQSDIHRAVKDFRKGGFIDPVDYRGPRGDHFPKNVDYGIVALAENPWAPAGAGHVACVCAGVSGPGTAGAVEMLAIRDSIREESLRREIQGFVAHPWGGVLKVSVPQAVSWERRFWCLHPKWDTIDYDPARYLADLSRLVDAKQNTDNPPKSVRECLIDADHLALGLPVGRRLTSSTASSTC